MVSAKWFYIAVTGCSLVASVPAVWAQPVAEFSQVTYSAQPNARVPEDYYRNPVLPGFYPDPSIVKVGEDFYLVTSTFAWFPSIPVFHSRDLVNWRMIGHAAGQAGQLDMSGIGINRGIFAPAISHHRGRFYVISTCIDCGNNFYVTATDPAGPWSQPVWLPFGGIDPSIFFDDNNRAYVTWNDEPPGPPRYDGHRALWLQEIDLEAGKMLGTKTLLVDGGVDPSANPVWAEGPHIYHVGDYYYLMAAEGGTADQHSETIYRSDKIEGPYKAGPRNPILTQRDMPSDREDKVEATGHADLVQLDDNSWWGVFLATRPFAGQSTLLGRETWLLPVRWDDGWPIFLDPGESVPMSARRPALSPGAPVDWSNWSENFAGEGALSEEWLQIRSPISQQWYAIDRDQGVLQIVAGADSAGTLGKPAFLGRRLQHHATTVTATLNFQPDRTGDFAGLLAFMDETHFLAFGIEGNGAGGRQIVVRKRDGEEGPLDGSTIASMDFLGKGATDLSLSFDGGKAELSYRQKGASMWSKVGGKLDVEYMATINAGLFTGLVVGPYAVRGTE